MTDKELLELAAKAMGLKSCGYNRMGGISIHYDDGSGEWGAYTNWNPLTNDGDALRLAVKLKMNIECLGGATQVNYHDGMRDRHCNVGSCDAPDSSWYGDPYAATRRAIVRAAAEIGKEMK
jgi:hypothetical protein